MKPNAKPVLGIETSCDETAAAVVSRDADGRGVIHANVVLSQIERHAAYGGVVPEIAARAHVDALDGIVRTAMAEAGVEFGDLGAVAGTAGPGLIGGVLVGLTTAKAIAYAADRPLIAINHLEGHALTARLTDGVAFPYLMLLVSGGHSQFVLVRGVGDYRRIGTTIDDALGEAFDKAAKLLGLGYPGGPAVEAHARNGDPQRFALPRPLAGRPGADLSFSGLKTALRLAAEDAAPLSDRDVADLCASFQAAAVDVVADRTRNALRAVRDDLGAAPTLVVAGGVAANRALADALQRTADREGAQLIVPPPALCTDNGAMIAWAGVERLELSMTDGFDAPARARWPLDPEAAGKLGSGRKGVRA